MATELVNPCTFAYDSTGKITNGTQGAFAPLNDPNWPANPTIITFDDSSNPTGKAVFFDSHHYLIQNGVAVYQPDSAALQLTSAQTNKSEEITNAEAADINGGFTSSALGAVNTYLSDEASMLLLTGEYAYVKGSDYDGNPIPWYTKEAGYTNHTQAQFVQMYLDGRKATQLKKVKGDTKRKQVAQCTMTDQVATIAYPTNPNPPSVPAGLTGTAGTQQVSLSWTANTDVTMFGGGGYNVYQNGTKINTFLVTTNSFTVTGLTTGTSYKFTITAVDTDGLESTQCTAVSVTAN